MRPRAPLKVALAAVLIILGIVGLASVASAADPKDKEAMDIAGALTCRTCQGQSVAQSSDRLAQSMRLVIRQKLDEGQSREQILKYFVDRYGESILYEPPKTLWVLLGLGVIGAIAISLFVRRRWKSRSQKREPEDQAAYEAQVADESRQSTVGSEITWEQLLKEVDDSGSIANAGLSPSANNPEQRPDGKEPKAQESPPARPQVWRNRRR